MTDRLSSYVKQAIKAEAALQPLMFTEGGIMQIVLGMGGIQGESVGQMLHEVKEFWPVYELDVRVRRSIAREIRQQLGSSRDRIGRKQPGRKALYVRRFACIGPKTWAIFQFLTRKWLVVQQAQHEYQAYTNARMARIENMFLEEMEKKRGATVHDVWLVVSARVEKASASGAL